MKTKTYAWRSLSVLSETSVRWRPFITCWARRVWIDLMVEKLRSQGNWTLLNGHRLRGSLVGAVALFLLSSSLLAIAQAGNAQDSKQAKPSEGRVVLHILIAADGSVKEAVVSESCGYTAFDEAAVEYARTWKLKPATKDGNPVESWATVPVSFKLTDQPKDDAKKIGDQQIVPADHAENSAPAE